MFNPFQRIHRLRKLAAVALTLGLALLLLILLYLTDFMLSLWERLQATPTWFLLLFGAVILAFVVGSAFLVWRLIRPRKTRLNPPIAPLTEAELEARLAREEQEGRDVAAARRELAELRRRKAAGKIEIALLGDISSGKSSLIKALLPTAAVEIDPRGGTTRTIEHYVWTSAEGDQLVITDLPGLNEVGNPLSHLTREEVLRCHLVIYVCDGDLTRTQYAEVEPLLALKKPMVLALNKIDQLRPNEIQLIKDRLASYLQGHSVEVVAISAGGQRELIKVHEDGTKELVVRQVEPNIQALAHTLQRLLDGNREVLDHLRDASVFVLAARKLDQAVAEHRERQSQAIISSYAHKAVVGAMAAVAPGSDLVIQGYLSYNLVKELCDLHQVSAKQMDIQQFLQLATTHVSKTLPLVLAISGNICKAFPGVGTLAGGLFHAVAYGLIFESLGKAVAGTLASRGDLAPLLAMKRFEEDLGDDMETRATRLVKLALEETRGQHHNR